MSDALKGLMAELEAYRGEASARALLIAEHCEAHALLVPVDPDTCHELKALAEVFDCEPAHLALLVLKTTLGEMHHELDQDLDSMAAKALDRIRVSC
jgi:hypothetical protein